MHSIIPAAFCVVALGVGQVALATPEITEKEKEEHAHLIALVEAIGVPVHYDGWPCKQGWHGGYKHDGTELVICANKQVSLAEKLNTVRHEAWHVYQDLRDCNLKDTVVAQPVFLDGVVEKSYVVMASKQYSQSVVPAEAEAAWAAGTFNAEQINILMFSKAKSCGYKL